MYETPVPEIRQGLHRLIKRLINKQTLFKLSLSRFFIF